MNAVLAERVAALEAERAIPTPRLTKPVPVNADTPEAQRRRREDLLADLRNNT